MSYTPGPWAVCHDHPDAVTAANLANIRPVSHSSPHDLPVATVSLCDYYEDGSKLGDTQKANATLIASSPELLEALEFMIASFDDPSNGFSKRFGIQKAKKAVAKAKGET